MTKEEARSLFSGMIEDTLDEHTRDSLLAYLAETPDVAAEMAAFSRTMTLLHRLPPEEPRLDIWKELAPRVAEYQAERKLGFWTRLKHSWHALLSDISAGVILWTHLLAHRAETKLGRYIWRDALTFDRSSH